MKEKKNEKAPIEKIPTETRMIGSIMSEGFNEKLVEEVARMIEGI